MLVRFELDWVVKITRNLNFLQKQNKTKHLLSKKFLTTCERHLLVLYYDNPTRVRFKVAPKITDPISVKDSVDIMLVR